MVLLHVSEFVVILASPSAYWSSPARDTCSSKSCTIKTSLAGKSAVQDFTDLLKLLYGIFMVGRRNGLIALGNMMDRQELDLQQIPPVQPPRALEFL